MSFHRMRKEKNFTQGYVAEKLNINRSTISKWENGEFLPSTENLIKLAALYNCTVDELLASKPVTKTN